MIRKNRIGIALATLAVSLTAVTGAAGAAGAETKVSIKGQNGDYYGTALNRAARLMSIAHGGQVVLSLTTEELVTGTLDPDITR